MALVISFFRALFQLRDRRFRRALVRSVACSAFFIAVFGLCAGWLLALLPDAVARFGLIPVIRESNRNVGTGSKGDLRHGPPDSLFPSSLPT